MKLNNLLKPKTFKEIRELSYVKLIFFIYKCKLIFILAKILNFLGIINYHDFIMEEHRKAFEIAKKENHTRVFCRVESLKEWEEVLKLADKFGLEVLIPMDKKTKKMWEFWQKRMAFENNTSGTMDIDFTKLNI